MNNQLPVRQRSRLTRGLALIVGLSAVLSGCGDHSVSGTYVAHASNEVALLQITETADHHFTGTLRHATLNNDGTLSSSTTNVSGSVDGSSITLTVLETPLPIGQNFSGLVSGDDIDLTVSRGAQTGVERFAKGQLSDFDAAVDQLNQAGQGVIAMHRRGQQVEQLDVAVNALSDNLNRFVARAHQRLERLPRAEAYYTHAVALEQEKLDRARHLAAVGSSVAQGQAGVVVAQMGVDRSQISITDDSFDQSRKDAAVAEGDLNAGIARWRGTCLDGDTVGPDDVVPDMGPCKGLVRAVTDYKAVLPALHNAFATASEARAKSRAQLDAIWRAADGVH